MKEFIIIHYYLKNEKLLGNNYLTNTLKPFITILIIKGPYVMMIRYVNTILIPIVIVGLMSFPLVIIIS